MRQMKFVYLFIFIIISFNSYGQILEFLNYNNDPQTSFIRKNKIEEIRISSISGNKGGDDSTCRRRYLSYSKDGALMSSGDERNQVLYKYNSMGFITDIDLYTGESSTTYRYNYISDTSCVVFVNYSSIESQELIFFFF